MAIARGAVSERRLVRLGPALTPADGGVTLRAMVRR